MERLLKVTCTHIDRYSTVMKKLRAIQTVNNNYIVYHNGSSKNMSLRTQNVMFRGANRRFLELITIELQYCVQWPISKRLRANTLKSSV